MLKDAKTLLVFFAVTLSLLIISYVLASWFWDKDYTQQTAVNKSPTVIFTSTPSNDSFKAYYTGLLLSLNKRLDTFVQNTQNIKADLDKRLADYYTYKKEEPVNVLPTKTTETNDIAIAKIDAIQKQALLLNNQTKKVDAENKRADIIIKQVVKNIQPVKPVLIEKTVAGDEEKKYSTFSASELTLAAESKTEETKTEATTEKIACSFVVKNNSEINTENEIMVVVMKPDGRVMKNSPWESGVFATNEGRKVYSCRMKNDYNPGEVKRLNFSLNSDEYQKGTYTLQVYTNGKKIGEVKKELF